MSFVDFNISVTTAAIAGYPGYGLLPVYLLLAENSRISRNTLRDTKEPRRELTMLILISVLLACLALYSPPIFRNEIWGVQCAPCAGLGAPETCCFDADHARFNRRAVQRARPYLGAIERCLRGIELGKSCGGGAGGLLCNLIDTH